MACMFRAMQSYSLYEQDETKERQPISITRTWRSNEVDVEAPLRKFRKMDELEPQNIAVEVK